MSKVYIKTDTRIPPCVTACEGGCTEPPDLTDWELIDQGTGDRYALCQTHYFPGGLYTLDGICRYKYVDGACILRTDAEIEADRAAIPAAAPTASEKLRADVDFLSAMTGVQL
ncbi:MAG: hypothetical protein VB060_00775 [Oscillibacter sp.]|nr:hypothetical protein [Oscillibacter sp.]MEA4992353.1 hypothetical protein [Oscillibacter sp.]